MATLFKWLTRAVLGLAVLGVLAAGILYYIASHSLPDYRARAEVRNLTQPLEIVRDSYAVPHIFGASDRDVIFGLGFAHAQDRLFQMMLLRRTAQGRLSEVFGEETYNVDLLLRGLDLYGVARRAVEVQTPQTLTELQAYSDGVNAYLERIRDEALGRGAPEFFLFSNQISPWTPADSIALIKLMALQLTDKAEREVLRAKLSLRLSPERLADLLPASPMATIALPEFSQIPWPETRDFAGIAVRHPLSPVRAPGLAGASNAWAASGTRAASGKPLLANDPHLGLTAPSQWYLARLELAAGGAIGGTIPGIPGILAGRNPSLAWGITSSYLDDQDIYIERLNPENPGEYLTPEGFTPFSERRVVIDIKDAQPRTEAFRSTRHGPVIPGNHFGIDDITPEGHVASLAWTALTGNDRSIESVLGLMRAGSIADARDVASLITAPALTLTLADANGIALQMTGAAPIRQAQHGSKGQIPAAGWVSVNDWTGLRNYADHPASVDPASGIVVNTNNRLTDAPFPDHISFDWGDTQRIERANRVLGGRQFHTLDSFVEAQSDTVSNAARTLLPLIGRDLWYAGEPAAADTLERRRQVALEALAAWNGEMSEHAPEPLIYAAWLRALQRRLIIDDIGPLVTALPRPEPLFIERVFRNIDGAGVWCDIRTSTRTETCAEMSRQALDDALLYLSEQHGNRIEGWRWGEVHQAVHRHEVLGNVPVLGWLFNIRQNTPGGDHTLMRARTPGNGPTPFANVHAGGLRIVVDFADPDASRFIIATGQSGHFLSRHYDDLSILWRRGEFISMSLDPDRARGGGDGVTVLEPKTP